jgi:hypothetical protein
MERLGLSRKEVAELHAAMTGLIAATQRPAPKPAHAPEPAGQPA